MTEMPRCGRVGVWRVVERKCISRGEFELNFYLSQNFFCCAGTGLRSAPVSFWLSRMPGMIAGFRIAQLSLME